MQDGMLGPARTPQGMPCSVCMTKQPLAGAH